MSTNKLFLGLTIVVGSVCAQPSESVANDAVGKVGTVFAREGTGLYIEKKLLRKVENEKLWADVHFATSEPGDVSYEMFKLPPEGPIEHGDLVMTKIGHRSDFAYILAEHNKVTMLVAKHDTLMAMTFKFGLPSSGSSQTALVNAFLK